MKVQVSENSQQLNCNLGPGKNSSYSKIRDTEVRDTEGTLHQCYTQVFKYILKSLNIDYSDYCELEKKRVLFFFKCGLLLWLIKDWIVENQFCFRPKLQVVGTFFELVYSRVFYFRSWMFFYVFEMFVYQIKMGVMQGQCK
eukprot:TRINITY_DN315_c1_g1_i1.p3 TRINITY_DN315_c1_g1~~TRINITY_DN315_c1_g1_i1.p3  ORF type:complete len:141 (-),score=3.36 TRINITY_DN315_c1_g1_i1:181-603(-)